MSFFFGLICAGEILFQFYPESISQVLNERPIWIIALGGYFVGFGTGVRFCFM